MFDKDEFETWREHPITRKLMDELIPVWQKTAKTRSAALAWEGMLDPVTHACLRECVSRLEEIRTLTYEDFTDDRS